MACLWLQAPSGTESEEAPAAVGESSFGRRMIVAAAVGSFVEAQVIDMRKKEFPIAVENFASMIRKGCYYVDKTPFIETLMEDACKVQLMTRPRRFGKTLFLDMLKNFLQIDFNQPGSADGNAALFAGLKIAEKTDFCRRFMGQWPVISLSLKGVEGKTYAVAYRRLAEKLSKVAALYDFLRDSPRLTPQEKEAFSRCLSADYLRDLSHEDDCTDFLKNLTIWLSKHFGRQVVLLIDEYDVPLAKAARFGYYDDMLDLVRAFLGGVLKEDPQAEVGALDYVLKAVLTGCLRVSKESIFTDVNNFDVNTVCSQDRRLNQAIGFGTEEVRAMLTYYGLEARLDDVRTWYDGYRFAGEEIYCPWDVINFSKQAVSSKNPLQYQPENFWENTSSNSVIEEFLEFLTSEDAGRMQTLVDGGTVDLSINDKLTYGDFAQHNSDDFWTLLLFTGYLTVVERLAGSNAYRVKIPNAEVRDTFEKKVRLVYSKANRRYARHGEALAAAFLSGDAAAVRKTLLPLLRRYVSVRDGATKAPPENYYHGFLLAMLVCAGDKADNLRSNREGGAGFPDLVFNSDDLDVGVVIEVKCCDTPAAMPPAAEAGLAQIKEKRYAEAFDGLQCRKIYGFAVAFCQKLCVVASEALSAAA